MRPDSLTLINVNVPEGSLPPWVLGLLLVGFFVLAGMLIQKAGQFKTFAADFPSQTAPVVIGLAGFIGAMPIILSRMALGLDQMGGTGDYLAASCALAGVSVVGLGVKRFSSPEYQEGKARVEAAKAGAQPPQVNVTGDATVNATTERPKPVEAKPGPKAGVKPSDPTITATLESYAARQRDSIKNPGEADD